MGLGVEDGDTCNRDGCDGVMALANPEADAAGYGCSCHFRPPCSVCTDTRPICPTCGHDMGTP